MRRLAVAAIRARSVLVAMLAVTVLAAGCGGGDGGDDAGGAGTRGRVRPGTDSTIFGAEDPTTSTTSTATGSVDSQQSPATTQGGTAPGSVAGVAPGDANAAEATTALNAYFDALGAERYNDAVRASAGAPRLLAQIRALFKRFNESQGGTTTQSYTGRSFTVATSSPTRVAFSGAATLKTTTVSGDRRGAATAEFAGPVVTKAATWQVTDLQLDRRPVVWHPSGQQVRHPKAPVTFYLVGALSSSTSTGVVVNIRAEREVRIQIDEDALKYSAGARNSKLRFLAGNDAYFSYARRDDRPTGWRARIDVDGQTAVINIPFG